MTSINCLAIKFEPNTKNFRNRRMKRPTKSSFGNVGNVTIQTTITDKIPPKALAVFEFQNRDANTVPDEGLVEDYIWSLEIRLALNRLPLPRHLASQLKPKVLAEAAPFPAKFPTESPTGLECLECLGNNVFHPQAQLFTFWDKYVQMAILIRSTWN
ncbi:hypothetical protein AJ80_00506 [Polytolypa hystricis UAMH7299]|uniref:Uncharacterized protein n=1 Tax=Polytolypa hystricis (strain UAMH7299) TaxID=1447883 RepID=A0A2B7Z397_POLH7|nr:hypothetical protein AJ80_00506 [Polytolypa hystricis UAMH7299]